MAHARSSSGWPTMDVRTTRPVQVKAGRMTLDGLLVVPPGPTGVVLFAHGSGSGRLSPRNTFVARTLQDSGLATLMIDLLGEGESEDRAKVFDIDLLADRLLAATQWLNDDPGTRALRIGYFGASTGAGAALQAAARQPETVAAVVSRGGRPDLAEPYLRQVLAPTLLIVGGHDFPVIEMNRQALALLTGPKQLIVIPGATHLFEEPGALEQVANHAGGWFRRYVSNLGSDL